jgi:hypothetical protein
MKKLIGLKGGQDATFWEIISSQECELVKYPSIKNGKEVPFTLGMSDAELQEFMANKQKVGYHGYRLIIAGNPICAEDTLKEMGYDAFSNAPNSVDIYDPRGGERPNSGRPATGAMPTKAIRMAEDEYIKVKEFLTQLRQPSK